ncbi:hypothetical protein H5162_03740 [Pseudoalteromonas sp. SR41-8]|uniref:hypothetical protein n=1 Tax=Pseudoalteromonas sp. SR41-8 TaxID=2760946 RepID=UPI001602C5A6|nr:hypothetical protein [Pseudoalteromonas sp. SR41-8]MBB1308556.1 hypothetical protein [Pseudoalteromonas sp. SR41-8]
MSIPLDPQNKFVLISSLVLHHTAEAFPFEVSLTDEKMKSFLYGHGINRLIENLDEVFTPTIKWLNNERYIRRSTDNDDSYSITEKGLAAAQFKVKQAPVWFKQYLATKKDGEYFFEHNELELGRTKLKCTGPAINLLPENWLQADE